MNWHLLAKHLDVHTENLFGHAHWKSRRIYGNDCIFSIKGFDNPIYPIFRFVDLRSLSQCDQKRSIFGVVTSWCFFLTSRPSHVDVSKPAGNQISTGISPSGQQDSAKFLVWDSRIFLINSFFNFVKYTWNLSKEKYILSSRIEPAKSFRSRVS